MERAWNSPNSNLILCLGRCLLHAEGGNGVDAHELLRFINAGGNVVISGTSEGSTVLREVALQVCCRPPCAPRTD